MLLSNKADFKPKSDRRDKKGHFILIKRMIQQKETAIVNIYTLTVGIPNFIRQILLGSQTQVYLYL
jgi:hypothetical protein